jgi:hypothetical protein
MYLHVNVDCYIIVKRFEKNCLSKQNLTRQFPKEPSSNRSLISFDTKDDVQQH